MPSSSDITVSYTISLPPSVSAGAGVSSTATTQPTTSTLVFPVSPSEPLSVSVESARLRMNELLTAWKNEIGEWEKEKENRVMAEAHRRRRREKREMKYGQDQDEESDDDEVEEEVG